MSAVEELINSKALEEKILEIIGNNLEIEVDFQESTVSVSLYLHSGKLDDSRRCVARDWAWIYTSGIDI